MATRRCDTSALEMLTTRCSNQRRVGPRTHAATSSREPRWTEEFLPEAVLGPVEVPARLVAGQARRLTPRLAACAQTRSRVHENRELPDPVKDELRFHSRWVASGLHERPPNQHRQSGRKLRPCCSEAPR